MSCVLFAHRDADYFAPKLRERFPMLRILTAMWIRVVVLRLLDDALAPAIALFD